MSYCVELSRKEIRRRKEHTVASDGTVQGKTGVWEMRIGIEVHAQVQSNLKLFSGSFIRQQFSLSNSQISPIDIALPGSLPVPNDYCFVQAIKAALSLESNINEKSRFDRKHYYYHDLPLGYQITQFFEPISFGGHLKIELPNQNSKSIKINRIQIEIDSGKSIHDINPGLTMIDFNRSGVPLLEIITEPDIHNSSEACEFIKKLTHLLKHIGVCTSEVGGEGLRCDANISVKKIGDNTLGKRCEVKNLNSIKALRDAIEHEAKRQVSLLESGENFDVETRWFDPNNKTTILARKKDDNLDYRFMPEPDLPPIVITKKLIQDVSQIMPELPSMTKDRLQRVFGISSYLAELISSESNASEYFEKSVSLFENKEYIQENSLLVAQWMVNELFYYINENHLNINDIGVTPEKLVSILKLLKGEEIIGLSAKKIIAEIMNGSQSSILEIIEKLDCRILKINDNDLIRECQKVIDNHKAEVDKYKSGNDRMMRFFVGELMKTTKGKGDSKKIQSIFFELLKE